ncbi:hypothetical protein [Desulfosporosinus burensis]
MPKVKRCLNSTELMTRLTHHAWKRAVVLDIKASRSYYSQQAVPASSPKTFEEVESNADFRLGMRKRRLRT